MEMVKPVLNTALLVIADRIACPRADVAYALLRAASRLSRRLLWSAPRQVSREVSTRHAGVRTPHRRNAQPLVTQCLILIALSPSAFGADFMLAIGSPVAASLPATQGKETVRVSKVAKDALFAVRTEGCADPATARIEATAEGVVNGARQSAAVKLVPAAAPGVYVISRDWPDQGAWVVTLSGECAGAKAGALVPIGPGGFIRESSKFFPRFTTKAELEATLKSISGGSK
jgi:hypothetical protein